MKPVRYFSDKYLEACKKMSPDQIVEFLENYRLIHERPPADKMISLRIPVPLLAAFRTKCELEGARYQTQIKQLMEEWL